MPSPVKLGPRLQSIDALRGAVMILMALDHIRDFIHHDAISFSPTDLTHTYPVLFFTRWITHFCAPVFIFTAGLGAFLWLQRNRTKTQLSRFLFTRGLWLILLELTVMRLAYNFNLSSRFPVLLIILWVLGGCMVVLSALIHIPIRLLAILSIATIVLHNCLDGINASHFGAYAPLWNILHQVGAFPLHGIIFVVGYPLIPWIAVMSLGFCFGQIFLLEPARRQKILLYTGIATTLTFLVLRATNLYGDPTPWSSQKTPLFTLLSFLNCTKYPPSLLFLLMTLGPALVALAYLDRRRFKSDNPLIVFGRVPLFYFIAHFYLAHAITVVLALLRYGRLAYPILFNPIPSMGGPRNLFPPDFGYPLWAVYIVWIVVLAALYPLCRRYAKLKSENSAWWLSYL
jgi:uncharacterized membrane protein